MSNVTAIALFSGGLDSILAARLVMEQGITVKCLHFCSPFFGKPHMVGYWRRVYGLDVECCDISADYVAMLKHRPQFGFGKSLNPCVDCKILLLKHAKQKMAELGASFIISGAVLGQRPMSQRRDALYIISRESDTRDCLVRPLCAKNLPPSVPEQQGLIDREKLENFSGRGRDGQFRLAERMGITDIPTPAGGCKLCEKENARRYWMVLTQCPDPTVNDFCLANIGRQSWSKNMWLAIGRNSADNEHFQQVISENDILLKAIDYPGPLAVLRPIHPLMDEESYKNELYAAAQQIVKCTPKAVKSDAPVTVRVTQHNASHNLRITPPYDNDVFSLPEFDTIREEIHSKREKDVTP